MEKDEKEEVKTEPEKAPAAKPDEGSEPKATSLIDDANIAAERMEKANEKREELIRAEQELEARKALGGETEAGQQPEKKELTPKEYAEKVSKGEVPPKE